MNNTSKGILFLGASDADVRSSLDLIYTLIQPYNTKAMSNQPRLWPQNEFFSSTGREFQYLYMVQQQTFNMPPHSTHRSGGGQ